MKKSMKFGLAAVVLGIAVASPVYATTVTCDDPLDARLVTLTYDGSGIVCGPSGNTPPSEGDVMLGLGYNFLEKDDGDGDNNNGGLLDISGIAGTFGSFTIDPSVTDAVIVFKFGGGNDTPDWISFIMNGITSADWSVNVQQALSHATLYGTTSVPAPATLALLGLGALGLGFSRRRKQA